jgi:ankyrin repeat protein
MRDTYQRMNIQRDYGETSLISACRDGHAEIVRLLLGAGANKNAKTCVSARQGKEALSACMTITHVSNDLSFVPTSGEPPLSLWLYLGPTWIL